MSHLAKVPVPTLIARIRRSVVRSPFAPATVLSHPDGGLIGYLDERGSEFPGFKSTTDVSRSYPQGAFGSEFLGLLGEVSPALLKSPRYAHAKPGETVGTMWVIDSGLKPGEQVVVEGLQKLKEGTAVTPKAASLSGEGN